MLQCVLFKPLQVTEFEATNTKKKTPLKKKKVPQAKINSRKNCEGSRLMQVIRDVVIQSKRQRIRSLVNIVAKP